MLGFTQDLKCIVRSNRSNWFSLAWSLICSCGVVLSGGANISFASAFQTLALISLMRRHTSFDMSAPVGECFIFISKALFGWMFAGRWVSLASCFGISTQFWLSVQLLQCVPMLTPVMFGFR